MLCTVNKSCGSGIYIQFWDRCIYIQCVKVFCHYNNTKCILSFFLCSFIFFLRSFSRESASKRSKHYLKLAKMLIEEDNWYQLTIQSLSLPYAQTFSKFYDYQVYDEMFMNHLKQLFIKYNYSASLLMIIKDNPLFKLKTYTTCISVHVWILSCFLFWVYTLLSPWNLSPFS